MHFIMEIGNFPDLSVSIYLFIFGILLILRTIFLYFYIGIECSLLWVDIIESKTFIENNNRMFAHVRRISWVSLL